MSLGANTFRFYGSTYSGTNAFFVSSNGLITFGGADGSFGNSNLTSSPSFRAIAPLWDDWRTDRDSADMVLGKLDDVNANGTPDRLIIKWSQVQHYSSSPSTVTFQAILWLGRRFDPGAVHCLTSTFNRHTEAGIDLAFDAELEHRFVELRRTFSLTCQANSKRESSYPPR